jgi:hypothetical protein
VTADQERRGLGFKGKEENASGLAPEEIVSWQIKRPFHE